MTEQETNKALEELGLEIAMTHEQEVWHKVMKGTETRIKDFEDSLEVEREVLKLAQEKCKGIVKA